MFPFFEVCVRYSTNEWMNFADAAAVYMSAHGNDGAVDSFSFSIELPKNLPVILQTSDRNVEFRTEDLLFHRLRG